MSKDFATSIDEEIKLALNGFMANEYPLPSPIHPNLIKHYRFARQKPILFCCAMVLLGTIAEKADYLQSGKVVENVRESGRISIFRDLNIAAHVQWFGISYQKVNLYLTFLNQNVCT